MSQILAHAVKEGGMVPRHDPNRSIAIYPGEAAAGKAPAHYTVVINPHKDVGDGRWTLTVPFHYCLDPAVKPLDPPHALGVTNEVLLAIVAHRLETFQAGDFACDFNQHALDHVRGALAFLHARSQERANRGVGPTEK